LNGILPAGERGLALGDVVPTICGTVPGAGVPLATVESSLAVFGGDLAIVRRQRVHHCLRGLGRFLDRALSRKSSENGRTASTGSAPLP
jgi:hypothetical protein